MKIFEIVSFTITFSHRKKTFSKNVLLLFFYHMSFPTHASGITQLSLGRPWAGKRTPKIRKIPKIVNLEFGSDFIDFGEGRGDFPKNLVLLISYFRYQVLSPRTLTTAILQLWGMLKTLWNVFFFCFVFQLYPLQLCLICINVHNPTKIFIIPIN